MQSLLFWKARSAEKGGREGKDYQQQGWTKVQQQLVLYGPGWGQAILEKWLLRVDSD